MKFCDEIRSLKFRDNFLIKLLIDQNYEQFSEGLSRLLNQITIVKRFSIFLFFVSYSRIACRIDSSRTDNFLHNNGVFFGPKSFHFDESFLSSSIDIYDIQVSGIDSKLN